MLLILTSAFSLKALAIDDDSGPLDDVPLDGGLTLLVAAGIGYGASKLMRKKKKEGDSQAIF